ncbi:Kinesin-like protein [Vigna angularis]|uniref:Kinesin-like protein n=1 Tax=Phaseolus angularis TaxID=3914 RepID=A0A8T0JEF2_PHAAN|nr:Kinesin-like protein [Vigna angularis]
MPFLSEAASAIKSRFGFHDHPSASLSLVQNTPDLLKSATKDSLVQSSIVRNLSDWDDESVVGQSSAAVIIRMRPLSNSEISVQGYGKCVRQESCQTITWTGHPESRFTFDAVADENVSQENLFKVAGLPMVENCMGGYNSCMFAYGQTGSGKTHTMLGDIEGGTRRHSVNSGMTPRIFEHLFSRIQKEKEARRDEKLKFTCKCSFLEIYNEQILDLLEPSSNNLQIREDSKKGVYVENLKEIEVNYAREVIQLLIQGASNRKVAATNMNRASSRSHSVFTCIIESQWESQGVTHFRYARLNLVDLAGSESCSLETLSTLKFAQRAKYIKNNAIVNEDASGDVIAMRIQIQQLKKKDYDIALVGAFRREKDKEMKLQALRDEVQASMKLVKQREDEIQSLKMRLRFREAGIKRLEAVASEKISAETHLLKEKEEHLKEIEVLRAQVDRNNEKANSDPMMEDVRSDDNLVSKLAIQNQAEMDTIFKKLEVCLEEKEKLKSHVDDLTAKLEHEKSRTVNEGKQQMDLPSTIDVPVMNNNDQLELKAMVDAIAAASQREAEAHETAIILAKENDELKMKLKTLIEDNSKLIELYEQAAAENINRNAHKGEDAHETGSQIDNGCFSLEITKEEAELKGVVENLQHQLMEINEENEKLMNLYERAMQERDDLKRTLSCIGQDQVETKGFVDCPEKLVEVDGGERDLRVEIISQEVRGESENKYEPTTTSGSDMDVDCDAYEPEKLLKDDSEADVLVNSEKYNLSEAKLSEELSCATKKLERVDEHISDAVKTIASLGCAETATVQVDELSREIEITEHDIHIKRQQFESLKLKLSEAHERRTIVDKKLSALKYSLSNFPSTFSYFVQRETRARAVVKDLTSHLDHKKGKLADLQASKQGLENAKEKNQESEVELKKNIACIKLKLEEENQKHEDEKVLIAVENTQNIDSSLKNWHLRSKATDLLKFEEEKTTLQAEMKLSQQKLGVIRKELENLNKKGANVESQIEAVQLEIKQCLRNTEEKELALERVMKEKEMLLEFRDNCMTEIEHMIIELQQHVFEYDLKEGEMKILGEELQMDLTRAEELQTARVIAANNKNSFFSSISYSGMLEKLEDEMQNLHTSVQETRLLLEGISRAA